MFKKSVPPSIRQERFVPPSIRQNRFVHPSNRQKESFIRLSVQTENRSSVYPSKKIRSSVYPSKQKIVPPSRVQKYCFFARKTHFSIKNMAFSMEITNFAALYT